MPDFSDQVKTPPPTQVELTGMVADRFRVLARLGAGGMGEVYRAQDTKLERTIALKRMAWREGITPAARELFLREGRRASALNHANIAAIYDVIEDQGDVLLVMEYVEGSTLRAELGAPMPLDRFFPIAIQCADALIAAHARGILHGDVKPENIMLKPDGQVKLLDFGVARQLGGGDAFSATATVRTLLGPGVLAGTPVYMAPEVLRGETPGLGADIFALGIVFYEMLGSRHPFKGANITVTTAQILSDQEAVVLDQNKVKVPPRLSSIIARALAKNPARRYASAQELKSDLEAVRDGGRPAKVSRTPHAAGARIGIAAGLAALILIVALATIPGVRSKGLAWWQSRRPGATRGPAPRLAVLPPQIAGSSPELTAFADGLSAAVAAKLSTLTQNHDIQVIDSSRVERARNAAPDQALKELGANMTLQFVVQQSQAMNRVTYTLASAKNAQVMSEQTLTAPVDDPFTLQDRVADGVIQSLRITLLPEEAAALSVHGTTQPAAYDYYLEGKGYLSDIKRPGNIPNALQVVDRALQLDPSFGRAFAERGEAEWYDYIGTHQTDWVRKAKADCNQAIALGNAGADGHMCLGLVDAGTGNYQEAAGEYQKAIELDPTNARAVVGLASSYARLNRLADAENVYKQAVAANPNSSYVREQLGIFYLQQADYGRAAQMFQQAVQLAPESYNNYSNLGGTYLYMGKYPEAIRALEDSVRLHPTGGAYANLGTAYYQARRFADAARDYQEAVQNDSGDPDLWGDLADAYQRSGQKSKAQDAFRRQLTLVNRQLQVNPRDAERQSDAAGIYAALGDKSDALGHLAQSLNLGRGNKDLIFNAAVVYNDLGEKGDALEWLQKAFTAGYSASIVRDSPEFDNLRNDPQFQQLLNRALSK
ncbi:MAG TPA: tetratricopeptide repeat protein [Acidobacteriaceae bacterium]|nr:tetratricopeptide repeat protein [Acidobacteriaceae bacterium]